MFEFNINPDISANPDFFHNIWAVTAALRGTGASYFENAQKEHWKVSHDFGENGINLDFLFWHAKTSNSTDEIQITDKKNKTTDYVRRSQGTRTGINYQKLLFDVTTALVQKKFPNAFVKAANSGNDGDSYKGSSVGRNVIVEVEKAQRTQSNPSGVRWDNIYGSVRYAWKGWDAKRTKAEKIMQEINGMYGGDIFLKQSLSNTEKVQFYTIDVQLSFYREAINQMARLTDDQVDAMFTSYYRHQDFTEQSAIPAPNSWAVAMKQDLRSLRKALQSGNQKKLTESIADIIDVAENQLEFPAVVKMVGGIQNLFVRGSLRGFRLGAEDAEIEVPTLTLGQIGSYEPQGPMAAQTQAMGIAGGEGLISWLLSTLM
jgi:hypothetical protein